MCLPGTEGAFGDAAPTAAKDRAGGAGVPPPFGGRHRVDLTHVFRAGFPVAIFDAPEREPALRFDVEGYHSQWWRFHEHSGTHVDAPAHFYADGADATTMPIENFVFNVAVIDISERVERDPDTLLGLDDVKRYERAHGQIPAHSGVFMCGGWDVRAADADAYKNVGEDGRFHGPGFDAEAVAWLIEERGIVCIGVDTFSLDHGPTDAYPTHRTLLGAGCYGIEGLARLAQIPPAGAVASVGMVPYENGSGGPARVVAAW
jgi:kynurenine formamidase